MDQRLLSGVGNIYAQEALFKAAIRPTRHGNRLTPIEASRLFETLQETLQTAITYRGSSSRNYRDANGEEGAAQTLHAVYRKGGKPCPRCQTPLRSTRVGGRGSVFCPKCQK
jgi:formamidopyrimidine-DNA glycosylase